MLFDLSLGLIQRANETNIVLKILKNVTLRMKGEIMKKIILIIFASLMFTNIGFAEMKLIESKLIAGNLHEYYKTVCIDGYKFVSMRMGDESGQAVSIVQFYEAGNNQTPKPAKC